MKLFPLLATGLAALLISACASKGEAGNGAGTTSVAASSSVSSMASGKAASGATPGKAATSASSVAGGVPPGMNARGEVIDSSKVEAGHGTQVKVGEVEGEITGKPAAGSKFGRVKIGMTLKQVTDLIGQPNDQGVYITGKSFVPFYFGSDRHRFEQVYKGSGRLIFAGEGGFGGSWNSGTLIWIIHNAKESGTR